MKNLLYKEFGLSINPLFYLVLLFGALVLIPQWVYFLAAMYFLFIALPNIFTTGKAQNDIGFSAMLPVRRRDIVKARIVSVVVLEVLQIIVIVIFAFINRAIYTNDNYLLDTNVTYIGCLFIMYAIFNVIFFPMFYKTAYKIGIPVIVAIAATVVFSTAVELLVLFTPLRALDGRGDIGAQFAVLAGGIIIFILLGLLAFRISAKRFEKIDL